MSQHIHLLKQLTLLWPCYKANFKISGHWICKFFDIATVHQYSMCDMHLPWWVPVSEYVQYIALAIPPSYDSSGWKLDLTETQFSIHKVPSLCIAAYPVVLALRQRMYISTSNRETIPRVGYSRTTTSPTLRRRKKKQKKNTYMLLPTA